MCWILEMFISKFVRNLVVNSSYAFDLLSKLSVDKCMLELNTSKHWL